MDTVLTAVAVARALSCLDAPSGPTRPARTPVHTVYGGAHLFRHDVAPKLGRVALAALDAYAPDALTFAHAVGLPGHEDAPRDPRAAVALEEAGRGDREALRVRDHAGWLALTVRERLVAKLRAEPVEDYRIDFEDGYGPRSDDEEDGHAVAAAAELVRGLAAGTLPPFVGIRIKALAGDTRARAVRTLELFLAAVARRTGGALPAGFCVTLPKVSRPEELAALATLLEKLEEALGIAPGTVQVEAMIETPRALIGESGAIACAELARAARGRCRGAHLGAYDLAASLDVVTLGAALRHPIADVARALMKLSLAGTGVEVVDGATTELPLAPHLGKALTEEQRTQNRAAVHHGWRRAFADVSHALSSGIYQGWDLHPAQLVSRYAAVYAFFLGAASHAGERLASFVAAAARARTSGAAFDDAATGQGLLAFFLRALSAGAMSEEDAAARTGVSIAEMRGRSFSEIVRARA